MSSDDPPFLNIGTEVSAKYRGAFCEATIKVAKKLVKCKVSYAKGQTAMVNNDVVKGPLKVGSQVEVKQPDGQFLPATINKLTDQSTYTVVFDDGDERTLKRSSLCLQGARHFHESESLDNQPLTDPENFGAPVKKSRKRRRLSPGSSQEDTPPKRKCSYPPEFPVGKAVFLENDRRRSCWLPAVIVPAHYVMDESERTADTICLRSFKDGRFFAATQNELHDFSPDKEPLQSMLVGEVQAMYMCKPAIERATAYLDTGELPWDMDLFDKNSERPSPHRAQDHAQLDQEDPILPEDREVFTQRYTSFLESRGTPYPQSAIVGQKELDLCRLYKMVTDIGGMDRVTQEMKWQSIHLRLGLPSHTNASFTINRAYRKYLHGFEMFEKGKGPKPGKDSSKQSRKRLAIVMENSDEESQKPPSDKVEEKVTPKVARNGKADSKNTTEKTSSVVDKQARQKSPKVKLMKIDKTVTKETATGSEDDELRSHSTEVKSETSDLDGSVTESNNGEGDERRGAVSCAGEYAENDNVLVWYGKGKSLVKYQAKIQSISDSSDGRTYLVHYNGWNNRYNEWIFEDRLAGKMTGDIKPARPHFSKKKKKQKALSTPRATGSTTPSPAPSPVVDTPTKLLPPNDGNNNTQKPKSKEELLKKSPQSSHSNTTNSNSMGKKPRAKKRNTSQSEINPPSPKVNGPVSLDLSFPAIPTGEALHISPPAKSVESMSLNLTPVSCDKPLSSDPPTEIDEGIQVKREEQWDSPRGSTSSSSGHGSLSSSESGEEVPRDDLGGLAAVVAAADALVCAESVPETNNSQPCPLSRVDSDQSSVDGLSVLATQASQHTHSTHGVPTKNSSVESPRNPSPSNRQTSSQTPPPTSSPQPPCSNGYDTDDGLSDKCDGNKETTPPLSDTGGQGKKSSPIGKRKYTDSGYEMRKVARREELNFRIDFTQLPDMTREERTALIQQKIRGLQSRWAELRSEVAYLERKKRRARRKERESARLQASSSVTPPTDRPSPSPVQCH